MQTITILSHSYAKLLWNHELPALNQPSPPHLSQPNCPPLLLHSQSGWLRICVPGGAYAPTEIVFFFKTKNILIFWLTFSIQFLHHPFVSNVNNKVWFYQNPNFLGIGRFFILKLFWGCICAPADAYASLGCRPD